MKALIVEDDVHNRRILQEFLKPHAQCQIVVNGQAAVEAFQNAHKEGAPFRLICLDIMMPSVDGHSVLKAIRKFEDESDIKEDLAAKIIMTSALEDHHNVLTAFKEGCEGYVTKPLDKEKFLYELEKLGLV